MHRYVTSADGTPIAFERAGGGPALILISGIFSDREAARSLAERLATRFTVILYDRRGRGDSGDTAPYAPEREVEDVGALIAEAGGTAAVYGHSSGAGLALLAAAGGLPVTRLVLHEPPYGPDDGESSGEARALAEQIQKLLADGRRAEAIEAFFTAYGLPPEMIEEMSSDPKMQALAPTMLYDFHVMGEFSGGALPEALVRAVRVPTLVMAGGASPAFFRDTAERIVALLPTGSYAVLDGQDHDAPAGAVAPVVEAFLTAS